jgi:predicted RNA polymerase sigma factor
VTESLAYIALEAAYRIEARRRSRDIDAAPRRYAATKSDMLMRPSLSAEAVRLGRLVVELLDEPEAQGLLALMLLHEARHAARVDADPYAHAPRTDLFRRLGRVRDDRVSYERALALTRQPAEKRFLRRQLEQLKAASEN